MRRVHWDPGKHLWVNDWAQEKPRKSLLNPNGMLYDWMSSIRMRASVASIAAVVMTASISFPPLLKLRFEKNYLHFSYCSASD